MLFKETPLDLIMESMENLIRNLGATTYPIKKIPVGIMKAHNNRDFPLTSPQRPQRPLKPKLPPNLDSINEVLYIVLFISLFTIIGMAATSNDGAPENKPLLPIGAAVAFLCGFILYILNARSKNDWKSYQSELQAYNYRFENYEIEEERYQEISNEFKVLKRDWIANPNARPILLPTFVKFYLRSMSAPPREIVRKSQLGRSEVRFGIVLKEYFGERILENHTISNIDHSVDRPYEPDFVYFEDSPEICIDIEIDEPYDFVSRLPTHHIGSNDEERDDFFLRNDWFVIRFSEEQVVKWPNSCCRAIAQFVNLFVDDKWSMEPFDGIPDLITKERWDKEKSNALAAIRFRESYLKTL